MNNDIHISWTIDCEATQTGFNDAGAGKRAVRAFVNIVAEAGFKTTLFVMPADLEAYPSLLKELHGMGCEIGLHYHPQEEGYNDFCGAFSASEQRQMYGNAIVRFEDALGLSPTTFRTGSCSANDATFPVSAELGFTSCSHSMPGRRMRNLRANWEDAPRYVHYTHPANRLLEGGLDLIEVPVTTDPDSMLWSGQHPQDLRVELFDAKNHRYMIDKMLHREKLREHPVRSIVTLTHNTFYYDDEADFRTVTLREMIVAFRDLAEFHQVNLIPATISEVASAYRQVTERPSVSAAM